VVVVFLALPLSFLSGALFPVTSLPGWNEVLVDINPLTYAVDALRYALQDCTRTLSRSTSASLLDSSF